MTQNDNEIVDPFTRNKKLHFLDAAVAVGFVVSAFVVIVVSYLCVKRVS